MLLFEHVIEHVFSIWTSTQKNKIPLTSSCKRNKKWTFFVNIIQWYKSLIVEFKINYNHIIVEFLGPESHCTRCFKRLMCVHAVADPGGNPAMATQLSCSKMIVFTMVELEAPLGRFLEGRYIKFPNERSEER